MARLFIVSGVSGSGKSSIVEGLIARGIGKRIVTCTTRQPRTNNGVLEIDGVDYFFLSNEEFEAQHASGAFAEHALNYGKYYGTRKKEIAKAIASTHIAFAIVDTKGATSLVRLYPDAISVFIDVPRSDIRDRLVSRGDSEEAILRRLAEFEIERRQAHIFDFIIPNKNGRLDNAIATFKEIIKDKNTS